MPSRQRYEKYRNDQTTVWIPKTAHNFLLKNRDAAREAVGDVLGRLIRELNAFRKKGGAKARPAKRAAKKAVRKSAKKKGARRGG